MVVEGGGGGRQPPPSKTSVRAHVRGWWKTITTLKGEHTCSCLKVAGGGGGKWHVQASGKRQISFRG
jgi:hypothetical protein